MSDTEIDTLVEASAVANAGRDITGALVVAGLVFFQILEGPSAAIDALFAKIRSDLRHTDVTCLDAQNDREIRLFPNWAMRRVRPTSSGKTSRIKELVSELPDAHESKRQSLSDEIANLMRSALRAA